MLDRVGVTLPFGGVLLLDQEPLLARLIEAGFRDFGTGELNRVDAVTPLALLAGAHPGNLTLSTYVANVFTRGPGLLAMNAAALAEIAPGRARFGLGAGSALVAEQWNGQPFDRPFTRVRESLRFLRAVLAGERSDGATTFSSSGFRLEQPPAAPPKLVLAALGPRMQRLAAREADGVVLNFVAPRDVALVRSLHQEVDRVMADPLETIGRVFVVCVGDETRARQLARRRIAAYLTVPVYAEFQRWLGRGASLEAMWDRWSAGDRRGALEAVPEELIDEWFLFGDPAECAGSIRDFLDSGLDMVAMTPLGIDDAATAEEATDFLVELAQACRTSGPPGHEGDGREVG